MHKISYRFDDFEALDHALDAEDTDLELSDPELNFSDGQWLLATFTVGEDSTSVAARVVDRGDALRLTFEERDRLRLRHFANGNGRPTLRPPAPEEPPSLPPGSRALVVSGSVPVAHVLSELLLGWGAQVATVGSSEEALDWLRREDADLIVLDSMLPGLDCTDLCHALACERAHGNKPSVLVLGEDPTCAEANEALAAGADDFVLKPFRAQELRARILGLLEHRERLCG